MDTIGANSRVAVHWRIGIEHLRAIEPSDDEVTCFASELATFYNDAHNRRMMANTVTMSVADVREHVDSLRRAGGRPFLLERDGVLMGDADFRHVTATSAEFAILVGRRSEQARGLGTRFAILLHAFAFRALALERVYVSILAENLPSQRLFQKLGYQPDRSQAARAYADEASDCTYSLGPTEFEAAHGEALTHIGWETR